MPATNAAMMAHHRRSRGRMSLTFTRSLALAAILSLAAALGAVDALCADSASSLCTGDQGIGLGSTSGQLMDHSQAEAGVGRGEGAAQLEPSPPPPEQPVVSPPPPGQPAQLTPPPERPAQPPPPEQPAQAPPPPEQPARPPPPPEQPARPPPPPEQPARPPPPPEQPAQPPPPPEQPVESPPPPEQPVQVIQSTEAKPPSSKSPPKPRSPPPQPRKPRSPPPSPRPSPVRRAPPSPRSPPLPRPPPKSQPPPKTASSSSVRSSDDGLGPDDGNPDTPGDGYVDLPTVPENNPWSYGQWILKAVGNIVAVHMCAVPGTDKFFFMERPSGRHPDKSTNIAGYYDYLTNKFTNIPYTDSLFCAGHTVTQDGHIMVVGGHIAKSGYSNGLKGVRIFSRKTLTLHRVANMSYPRWYPTATLLPNGRITIMGGTVLPGSGTGKNPIYEIWDPTNPKALIRRQQSPGMVANTNDIYYPNMYVLPSGDLFMFCNTYGEIIEPMSGVVQAQVPTWNNIDSNMFTEYPFTGTSVMLPLTLQNGYTAEVVYFGGQFSKAWVNTTASSLALRIKVKYDAATQQYNFGDGWVAEEMPLPRVMGDAIVLPNGKVVLLNGAMKGLAGDSIAGGASKANEPNLWPVLYDPAAPLGSRMQIMSRSMIPRMYHSTASLTTDGSILVGGCDRCDRFWWTTPGGIAKSPTSFAEYRIEVFRPPSWFNVTAKPQIVSLDNSTWDEEDQVNVLKYGTRFEIMYSMFDAADAVTAAVLVAPSSTTHSTNMNQRVVGLPIFYQNKATRQLIVRGPPNILIAPPGWYMLFLLNGDVYGQSAWVRLPGNAPRMDPYLSTFKK